LGFGKEPGFDSGFWNPGPYTPPGALLRLLPPGFCPFEKLTAAMVAAAVERSPRALRLLLMASPPAPNLLPASVAGLLVQDLVGRRRAGRPLLHGDLLALTPAARGPMVWLQGLQLGDVMLGEVWEVESLTRYTPKGAGDKPRVYFANPGIDLSVVPDRRAAAIIIEAMLPSVLHRLPELLSHFRNVPISILIAPPLSRERWQAIPDHREWIVWLWDPPMREGSSGAPRHVWVSSEDRLEEALMDAEEGLGECLEILSDTFPPLREAWGIYHQLRQLAVPLSDLEESLRPSLRHRLDWMRRQDPPQAAAERRWGRLLSALDEAYRHLIALREPPKFWALAQRLSELLPCVEKIRIVVPRREHGMLLGLMLIQLFEQQAIEQIEILTPIQEARRVAAGEVRWTLLPGCRPATYRFLDVYFPEPVEVFAYAHEAELEKRALERAYDDLKRWQEPAARREALSRMGIVTSSGLPGPCQPERIVRDLETPRPRPVRPLAVISRPELGRLLEAWDQELEWESGLQWEEEGADVSARRDSPRPGERVHVILEDGRRLSYWAGQFVYVFYESLDQVQRLQARDLRPNMRLVLLVDASYEGIYERLLDALRKQAGVGRLYLDLWQAAKAELRKARPNLRDLYERLVREGLSVSYQAFAAYFKGDDLDEGTLAPQRDDDMAVLARRSGLFRDSALIRETFMWIQRERTLRRQVGRALHQVLRGIVTGEGYREGLQIAREIGHEIYDIMTAVELATVRDVCRG
jgi:hypothetical protein